MNKILQWISKLWHRLFARKSNRITILKEESVNLPVTIDEVVKDALQEKRRKFYHPRPMTEREKKLYYGRSYKLFENYKRHLAK